MDDVTHDEFHIARTYAKCPAHVWSAWSDPAKKARWMTRDAAQAAAFRSDFRPGGTEVNAFASDRGRHENRTTFFEIAAEERIVFAYSMALDGRVHSVSLVVVSFADAGGGTRVDYHERITLIGPSDGAAGRQHGWTALLDAVEGVLEAETETFPG